MFLKAIIFAPLRLFVRNVEYKYLMHALAELPVIHAVTQGLDIINR